MQDNVFLPYLLTVAAEKRRDLLFQHSRKSLAVPARDLRAGILFVGPVTNNMLAAVRGASHIALADSELSRLAAAPSRVGSRPINRIFIQHGLPLASYERVCAAWDEEHPQEVTAGLRVFATLEAESLR